MDTTFWQAILSLHPVAMAFFLGGQLIFVVTLAIVWEGVQLVT